MTYRERRERRAARRREWAAGRERKAEASFGAVKALADQIPLGQPLLVDHHSYRHARRDQDRIQSGMRRGVEHEAMARKHASAADEIERQADRAIYDDDPDAIERLAARIAELEADRSRQKQINTLYRKGDRDGLAALGLDLDRLRAGVEAIGLSWVKVPCEYGNLTANIRRLQKRLAGLKSCG